LRRSR